MKKLLLSTSCIVSMTLFTQPVIAQTADAESDNAGENNQGLDVIVVTATRRSENLQDAAVAISAVTGDALRNAGVTNPTELTGVIPSLQVATAVGPYSLFYLRGVGNFNGNSLSDAAVAFNFNDVFLSRPSGSTGFFYDLDRVEVVKGPQGTLFGRNATGGAINVIPAAPKIGELSGSINAEYGNYDAVRLDGAINVPLGDNAAARAAAIYVKHDGYMSDGTDDQDDLGARLSFLVEPTDNLTVKLTGDYFRQKGRGTGSTVLGSTSPAFNFNVDDRVGLSDPRAQAVYDSTYIFIGGNTLNGLPNTQFMDNEFWGISATVNWETPAGTITIIPAYREGKLNYRGTAPGFQIDERSNSDQFSFEARIASDDDKPVSYIAGLFYFDENGDTPLYNPNSQYNASYQTYGFSTSSMAAFGRLNYNVTPDITLTAGGRYTTEDKTFGGTFQSVNRFCLQNPIFAPFAFGACPGAATLPFTSTSVPTVIGGGPAGPVQFFPTTTQFQELTAIVNSRKANFERFTWRVGADWKVTPDSLLYANYETGFKSGGFFFTDDIGPGDGVYEPEVIKAFTIGSKNSFWNNRVRLNMELFHWKYKNQQISHLGSSGSGAIIFPTENVGNATFKGFEIEVEALVTENTKLRADLQYLDAKYNNFVYDTPNPPQTGCAVSGGFTVDCSGFRPPNAPKWTLNLGAEQTVPLANDGKIVLSARSHFQTETLAGLEFLPVEVQDSYWTADAAITYAGPDDKYHITAFVNNMFDETIVGNTFPPPLTAGLFTGSLRPPRTYGVRAGFNF